MSRKVPGQYSISCIIIALAVGINLGENLLIQFNVERQYLIYTLLAITLAGLLGHRALFSAVLVVGLAVAVNLPPELLAENHVNPELVFITLLAMVVAPTGLVLLGWQPSLV